MNILVLATGSVSVKLLPKLLNQLRLEDKNTVKFIMTEKAKILYNGIRKSSFNMEYLKCEGNYNEYASFEKEVEYYIARITKSTVLHIELAQWADVILVCPATANTIAKMCFGVSDNVIMDTLLVASGLKKRVIVAPAMNANMWESWQIKRNIQALLDNDVEIVYPSVKQLACGDYGLGALADLKAIVNITEGHKWKNPLGCNTEFYLPINPHPGSFGAVRKFDIHKGVDLYCHEGYNVYAVESGEIIEWGIFTGPEADCPWWNETGYILVQGKSGFVIYGEVDLTIVKMLGRVPVTAGQRIATVKAVLPPEKIRPDIPGHSNAMLHLELLNEYVDPTRKSSDWELNQPRPKWLLDPTAYLF